MKRILMCSPQFFRVDYVINPWMQVGSVDPLLAQKQWENLKALYEKLGVHVFVMEADEHYPDMVFSADQGIAQGKKMIMSSFCHDERKGESIVYEEWLADHGWQIDREITECFEGGEVLRYADQYFVGTGFRAQSNVVPILEKKLHKPVTELRIIDERFYHLDTCLFVLNDTTIFYFKDAFESESIRWLEQHIPTLIEFSREEAMNFAANSVVVGQSVICQEGSESFCDQLRELGYEPMEIDVGEFMKSGGGVHCLTLELG
jgi:N-dimethylarginine dimethylaminohydrolase